MAGKGKQFEKGNKGKPPGTKSVRVKQWEILGEHIQQEHTKEFNAYLKMMLGSSKTEDRAAGAELFLKVLEYFKPKLARTEMKAPPGTEVTYTLKFK